MKKAIAFILVLALMLCAAAQAKGEYLGKLRVVNCSSWVTLRARPNTSAASVMKVPLGARVEAYYYNSQFTECYYQGEHGYILSTYLSDGDSGSSASRSSDYLGKRTIVNCREFVTLRKYASTSAPTVTKVARGQVVDAYYYDGEFCRCFYNGLEGYILSYYLGYGESGDFNDYLGTLRIVNCDNWVTLRASPSTSAGTVTRVPWGAEVEAYAYNSQFAECWYRGMHGYILMKYLG